jgi:hypothetical protein
MTDTHLTPREEDIQRLIVAGVKQYLTIEPFRWQKLHQANDKIRLGKKDQRSIYVQCSKAMGKDPNCCQNHSRHPRSFNHNRKLSQ